MIQNNSRKSQSIKKCDFLLENLNISEIEHFGIVEKAGPDNPENPSEYEINIDEK